MEIDIAIEEWKLDSRPDPFDEGVTLPQGLLYPGDETLLREHATKVALVVDIGTFYGRSAAIMACVGARSVITIEPFDGGWVKHGHADHSLETVRRLLAPWPSVEVVCGHSTDAAVTNLICDGTVDVLFIDGDHTKFAVARDFVTYYPKMKRSGIVIFNDFLNPYSMPGVAVKEVVESLVSLGLIDILEVRGCSCATRKLPC